MAAQGNLNPTGQPAAPPNIQSLRVTANEHGHFHADITDQSTGLRRGVNYGLQYDTSSRFTNPIPVHLGPNRNWDKFFGNTTLHFRAFSYYDSSNISQHVYHGSASNPTPVTGGGPVGGPTFQASQGTGTDAAGAGNGGPGPIPERTADAAFDWTLQKAQGSRGGFPGTSTPAGIAAGASSGSGGGGGGGLSLTEAQIASVEWLTSVAGANTVTGKTAIPYTTRSPGFLLRFVPANTNSGAVTLSENGITAAPITKNGTTALVGGELQAGRAYLLEYDGTHYQIIGQSFPISALVLASDASGVPVAAVLASGKIWIGSAGNLPVAQTPSGDISINSGGVVTVTGVNGATVPASAALVGTNGSGQVVSASAFTSTSFVPVIQIGGSATSITFTYTATSSKTGTGTGAPVTVVMNITITGWPVLPSGTVTIGGLPVTAGANSVGAFAAVSGFVGLSAGVSVIPVLSGTTITLDTQGTTGVATLPAATIANGSVFTITITYQSS